MPFDLGDHDDTDALHNKIDAMDNGLTPDEEDELLFDGPEPADPFLP